ncbi:MAG: cytochrome ubiquinol oxidase subunit I [Nitrospiraceae bacterium]|nr:cytochrome ubiquinol oxidase subunit I [Nitrospiraceae bacterium]
MDTLALSRLQFAITAMFHFIFVPLTLGLSILVAWMESRYLATGEETFLRMAKFWGKLFLINFALGVVTGITMEFQFGMNWSAYSRYVGDIFGAPLAIEATVAFFLESTFIGLWVFGWDKVSKKTHALAIWLVALATNLSALWILLANGWMQHPSGYVLRNNRAEMTDFLAVATNSYGWLKFLHTVLSGYVVAAFFVMGISAWHLLKKNETEFFRRSFRIGAAFGLAASLLVVLAGDFHAKEVAETQPSKFAAIEANWKTTNDCAYSLVCIPDVKHERNYIDTLKIPGLLSFLAFGSTKASITGLKDIPKDLRPPVMSTFLSFRAMIALGFLFIILAVFAFVYSRGKRLEARRTFLRIMLYAIPLPYIAGQLGWIVAEVGRQPWIVYGVLKTKDAVSGAVSPAQVWTSLTAFTLGYGALAVVDIYLLGRAAKKGPDGLSQGYGAAGTTAREDVS